MLIVSLVIIGLAAGSLWALWVLVVGPRLIG